MNNSIRIGLSLLLVATVHATLSADTVDTSSGRGVRGKVTAMNANTVTVTLTNGKEQAVPAHTIVRISFDGEPNSIRTARRNFSEGQYNRVAESLDALNPDTPFQQIEKPFLLAMASAKLALRGEGGKTVKASHAELKAFIDDRANTKWYQYFLALETFGDLEAAMGNLDGAIAQYNMLLKSSSSEVNLKGQAKSAHVQVLQGKFAEAKASYGEVLKSTSEEAGVIEKKLMARVGVARCDAELSDAKAAITTIKEIIKKEDASKTILFGTAYNALAHCYMKDQQPKEAMLAFLHTDVLYQRDSEIHSEALYHLRSLFRSNQKPKQSDDADKLLTTTYRNTYWGAKAIKEKLGQ